MKRAWHTNKSSFYIHSRILPALSRHRPREHLHLSDERLDVPRARRREPPPESVAEAAAPPGPAAPGPAAPGGGPAVPAGRRTRCAWCRKRLSIATLHRCRCGSTYCAPHRYAEVHGCQWDYRAGASATLASDNPAVLAPKLPRI